MYGDAVADCAPSERACGVPRRKLRALGFFDGVSDAVSTYQNAPTAVRRGEDTRPMRAVATGKKRGECRAKYTKGEKEKETAYSTVRYPRRNIW